MINAKLRQDSTRAIWLAFIFDIQIEIGETKGIKWLKFTLFPALLTSHGDFGYVV